MRTSRLARLMVEFEGKGLGDLLRKMEQIKDRLQDLRSQANQTSTGMSASFTKTAVAVGGMTAAIALAAKTTSSSVQAYASFEKQMIDIKKTTGLTRDEVLGLKDDLLNLGSSIGGVTSSELMSIAEVAGQLGIQGRQSILEFTKTVAQMTTVSDMSAEDAANSFGQVINIFGLTAKESAKIGAVWDTLANQSVATEGQLADLTRRMAGAGKTIGMTVPEVAALAAALRDTGTDVEVGGTAMTQVMMGMKTQTAEFAKIAGMSFEDFSRMVKTKPVEALQAFLAGVNKLGDEAPAALDKIGLDGTRVLSTVLKLSQGFDKLNNLIKAGNEQWQKPTSLDDATKDMEGTMTAQFQKLKNNFSQLGESVGELFSPATSETMKQIGSLLEYLQQSSEEAKYFWGQILGYGDYGYNRAIDRSMKELISSSETGLAELRKRLAEKEAKQAIGANYSPESIARFQKQAFGGATSGGGGGQFLAGKVVGFLGELNKGIVSVTETAKFKFINAMTPAAKAIGDPENFLKEEKKKEEDRDSQVSDLAMTLQDARKPPEFSPQISSVSEYMNRIQMAGLKPEKSDTDIIKEALEKNTPKPETVDAIKKMIEDQLILFKENKLTFVGG